MCKSFPHIIEGEVFNDNRGRLLSCNLFDMSCVKRMYSIENFSQNYIRGWKGHKIETRWFCATKGCLIINTVPISDLETASLSPMIKTFELNENNLNVLEVPPGYATSIQQYSKGDRILVYADFELGVSGDEELRWDL